MKKSLLAFAALTALTGAACAQSSVTLFGVIDANVASTHNGSQGTVKQLGTSGLTPSRIGFRGVEDLGGGLKAGFWLEGSISADRGTLGTSSDTASGIGKTFDRRSTVSLMSEEYGELRLGRDRVPNEYVLMTYDPFEATGLGGIVDESNSTNGGNVKVLSALGRPVNTFFRADNAVSYTLPSQALYGIVGQLTVAPGEGVSGNRLSSGRLGYMNGPISAMAAYSTTQVDTGNNDRFRQAVVGASYDFGVIKPEAQFVKSYTKLSDTGEGREQNVYLLGFTAPIGMGTLRASYVHGNMYKGVTDGYRDSDDSRQIAVGYSYDLSKRTAVYATVAQIKNSGAATSFVGGSDNTGMLGGQNSMGYDFGIRHSF